MFLAPALVAFFPVQTGPAASGPGAGCPGHPSAPPSAEPMVGAWALFDLPVGHPLSLTSSRPA